MNKIDKTDKITKKNILAETSIKGKISQQTGVKSSKNAIRKRASDILVWNINPINKAISYIISVRKILKSDIGWKDKLSELKILLENIYNSLSNSSKLKFSKLPRTATWIITSKTQDPFIMPIVIINNWIIWLQNKLMQIQMFREFPEFFNSAWDIDEIYKRKIKDTIYEKTFQDAFWWENLKNKVPESIDAINSERYTSDISKKLRNRAIIKTMRNHPPELLEINDFWINMKISELNSESYWLNNITRWFYFRDNVFSVALDIPWSVITADEVLRHETHHNIENAFFPEDKGIMDPIWIWCALDSCGSNVTINDNIGLISALKFEWRSILASTTNEYLADFDNLVNWWNISTVLSHMYDCINLIEEQWDIAIENEKSDSKKEILKSNYGFINVYLEKRVEKIHNKLTLLLDKAKKKNLIEELYALFVIYWINWIGYIEKEMNKIHKNDN